MKTESRQPRKSTVWTRDKIAQLIQLYKKHECLWNHYTEAYKCKDSRNHAIDDICKSLKITKFDYGKKIHNLRNQFNSEMKKMERRIEEAGGGGSAADDVVNAGRCRWEHFEALMFLRQVIEPRPGGYRNSFPQTKKMRMKYDYDASEDDAAATISNDEVTEYHFEDAEELDAADVDSQSYFEEDELPLVAAAAAAAGTSNVQDDIYDRKFHPPANNSSLTISTLSTAPTTSVMTPSTKKSFFGRVKQNPQQPASPLQIQQHQPPPPPPPLQQQQHQEIYQLDNSTQHHLPPTGATIELPVNSTGGTVVEQVTHLPTANSSMHQKVLQLEDNKIVRDQWDAFGELIANELRHFNSDISRKRLKRKIMQAMLEVGEEDDGL